MLSNIISLPLAALATKYVLTVILSVWEQLVELKDNNIVAVIKVMAKKVN